MSWLFYHGKIGMLCNVVILRFYHIYDYLVVVVMISIAH